jgi:hypothetical protein
LQHAHASLFAFPGEYDLEYCSICSADTKGVGSLDLNAESEIAQMIAVNTIDFFMSENLNVKN